MCADDKGGIGAFAVLGIAFVILKFMDTIDWSWWWVLAPFWGPYALGLTLLVLLAGAREAAARNANPATN